MINSTQKIINFIKKTPGIVFESNEREELEFYKFLNNTKDILLCSFENNWPYILQSTRNGRFKFYYKNSIVYFTLRFNTEYDNNYVVIVNSLGYKRREAVIKLCDMLSNNDIEFVIKNIDRKELPYWLEKGFKETVKPWSNFSFRDDNTFPCHIFISPILSTRKFNKGYKKLFNKLDRKNILTEEYNTSYDKTSREFLEQNAKFLFQKGVDNETEIIRAHLFIFDESIKSKIKLQHLRNEKLIGVSFLTKVKDTVFYNALLCKNEKNLMKYLVYCGTKHVISKYPSVKYFSLQGSENAGQDFFKRRYKPAFSIEKTHLTK